MGGVTVNRSRFYIGDLHLFIHLGEKEKHCYCLWFRDHKQYENLLFFLGIDIDIPTETTLTFPNSLFYLLAYAFALISITFDIYLFLPIHRELSFLLYLHLV